MKKLLLLFIFAVVGIGTACAGDPIMGIFATYDGAETSYKLEDVPTVKYEEVGGVNHAVLYLKDKVDPVLSVALADGKTLSIVYGEYDPTSIEGINDGKATIVEKDGKKFIQGGKLIIISKDGNKYNAAGVLME